MTPGGGTGGGNVYTGYLDALDVLPVGDIGDVIFDPGLSRSRGVSTVTSAAL